MIQPDKKEVAETAAQVAVREAAKALTQKQERRERFSNTANKVLYLLLPVLITIIMMLVLQNNYTSGRATKNDERFQNLQTSIDRVERKLDASNASN